MPKITTGDIRGLLIKFVIKIILSTVLGITLLTALCSVVMLKLDLDLKLLQYVGTAICIISAFLISLISISGFKNNYIMLSMISVLPLLVYTVINFCFNGSGAVFIIIRIFGVLAAAIAASLIKSGKKLR